ncbi:hypothetical protein X772_28610 [Mesorhizobium sp. LSJC280B00]|nr:hypothetical protein X772_28610 [Mesorhizobium sp. LSJC280B00]
MAINIQLRFLEDITGERPRIDHLNDLLGIASNDRIIGPSV